MLDPRIYRTGLVVAALALVVLAFSLRDQQAALSPTLAPEAFNGQNVYSTIKALAAGDPARRPGSLGDDALAAEVTSTFSKDQFTPSTDTFTGRTVDGTRTLENVVGVKPGMKSGSIVIVADRDSTGAPAAATLSATATLMELARDLEGETLTRTVVLASITGSQGTAGAIRLASRLSGPVDAVIVLGDLASARPQPPIVVPWTTRQLVAPPVLRNTLASALAAQTSLTAAGTSLGGQFAHLAFSFTLGEQAPFGALGVPAVTLSLSGERGPLADEPIAGPGQLTTQLTSLGRSVLQTISALDGGPEVPAASTYLLFDGKIVPGWAVSLFVLALLVPVMLTTVDGVARARRRGHVIWRSVVIILAAAVPFLLVVGVVLIAALTGIIDVAPPGPVAAGVVARTGTGTAVLVVAALAFVGSLAGVRAVVARMRASASEAGSRSRASEHASDGAVAALLVVMCVVTFAIWVANPFAAALLVPALHLWLWAVNPDLRLAVPVRLALVTIGLVPAVLVVVYYADTLGFGPMALAWGAVLMLAGHAVSLPAALEWSVVLGCLVSVATLAVLAARGSRVEPAEITVRGPITYAGPGSLGGTKSALRR